jgi:quinolinate synthase
VTSDADVIVLAGVHFMAETAKLVNPGKTVLMPDRESVKPLIKNPSKLAKNILVTVIYN